MEFEYANLWKEDGIIILLPMIIIREDSDERCFALGWLIWGFEWGFKKKPRLKKYAICKTPLKDILTKNKEYQIIKSVHNSYIVKRDDGSIDKVDKSRFSEVFEK